MKSCYPRQILRFHEVTLCVRVWIEMYCLSLNLATISVTLCVRVWIEICTTRIIQCLNLCHPLREGVD